jgi:membrane protease YdiL (CAAX protease family)
MIEKRNIALYVIVTLVTCGLFGLYWFVVLTDDTNKLAGEADTSGVIALLLTIVTCGLYGLYWAYKRGEKIDKAKQMRNIPASNGGILYLILYFFGGIIAYALIQNEINNLA